MESKGRSRPPLIIDIEGNSQEDGPGIRSVVFLKGCPLDCLWCQNPESKKIASELWWDKEKCIGCGDCIKVCPEGAISEEFAFFINRNICRRCFRCVDVCPSTALKRVGQEMSVEEIVAKVTPFKPFFRNSGGGVTLSGGEPTLFMDFASSLLKRLKEEGMHTLVETNGFFDFDNFSAKILPYVDTIYIDIKIIDPEEHKRWCGVSNERILQNFIHLHKMSREDGFEIKPRTPLIPGITDTDDKTQALAQFYQDHGVKRAALEKNNPIWFDKLEKICVETNISKSSPMRSFYDQETFERIKKMFEDKGIEILES